MPIDARHFPQNNFHVPLEHETVCCPGVLGINGGVAEVPGEVAAVLFSMQTLAGF